jgi:vitamin B12 transporter
MKNPFSITTTDDSLYGGSIDLTWQHGINNVLFGLDFDKGKLESEKVIGGKQYLKKWAIYSNDTIMIDRFSLTPGIRYDHTNTNGDYVSPSFGLTYMMTERNLLRGYITKGFHIPPLSYTFAEAPNLEPNPDLEVEKILSIQVGIESTSLKYLWLKTNLFRHNISDSIVIEPLAPNSPIHKAVNKSKQRRQGIELEVKTVSVYNTSLFAGFSYIDEKDTTIDVIAKYTFDIGINYYNNKSFWANLKGHYICWDYLSQNPFIEFFQDHIFIWDINLIKEINWDQKINIRTFLTVHNIFNGSPYQNYLFDKPFFEYPGRWIETGLKFNF